MRRWASVVGVLALCWLLMACSSKSTDGAGADAPPDNAAAAGIGVCPAAGASKSLTGAGATFPYPLYSKWLDTYEKACGVRINYQSIGSGAGIQQIIAKTVDFGASDGLMTDKQIADATAAAGPILHIPTTLAPVAVVVNLPGLPKNQLKLTPDVLADIYLKKIKKWNDDRIKSVNPGVNMPNSTISVVHRSDGSGTTNIFTNYLAKISPEWKSKVGSANSVNWPGDVGGQGNEGVTNQVRQLPGTIGYVDLAYAKQTNLSYVLLRNQAGNFIEPSLDSAAAAASGVSLPDDMRIVLTDSPNPQAYPITSFTWVLVYKDAPDAGKGKATAAFLWWAIHNGQKYATSQFYPVLSADATSKAEAQVRSLMCGGEGCLAK